MITIREYVAKLLIDNTLTMRELKALVTDKFLHLERNCKGNIITKQNIEKQVAVSIHYLKFKYTKKYKKYDLLKKDDAYRLVEKNKEECFISIPPKESEHLNSSYIIDIVKEM